MSRRYARDDVMRSAATLPHTHICTGLAGRATLSLLSALKSPHDAAMLCLSLHEIAFTLQYVLGTRVRLYTIVKCNICMRTALYIKWARGPTHADICLGRHVVSPNTSEKKKLAGGGSVGERGRRSEGGTALRGWLHAAVSVVSYID